MIHVQAPSRLHFGLMSFGADELAARQFGSVGLMVQHPGVAVVARPAAGWSAEGPLADRALTFAHELTQTLLPSGGEPQHLIVAESAPEHVGLGTGTQLGLAVARAVSLAWGIRDLPVEDLARRIGRGRRSALGVHGFAQGGFVVDGGKRDPNRLAPLVARANFPDTWRVVLVLPPGQKGLHGPAEVQAFGRLADKNTNPGFTDRLCRLALLGMLPALAEQDLDAFGEAVFDFNTRVGEAFAPAQGGVFASPRVGEVVAFIRTQGIQGVGQSSWGPAVFAITADEDRAWDLVDRLRVRFAFPEPAFVVTAAAGRGACVRSS
jgi:beta-RFAP synthase